MNYLIFTDGEVIAQFQNEYDRNLCLDALREEFPDCIFTDEIDEG